MTEISTFRSRDSARLGWNLYHKLGWFSAARFERVENSWFLAAAASPGGIPATKSWNFCRKLGWFSVARFERVDSLPPGFRRGRLLQREIKGSTRSNLAAENNRSLWQKFQLFLAGIPPWEAAATGDQGIHSSKSCCRKSTQFMTEIPAFAAEKTT